MNLLSALADVNPALYDLASPVLFFPVRHHSPASARIVREVIHTVSPAAILIEGPSDYNPQIAELNFAHQLPIAIYSYVRLADGSRRGAFYPFCVYSPEWVALRTGNELGIPVQFIDLPWAAIADRDLTTNRYADETFREGGYIDKLCHAIGVDSFDDLWDTLFEIEELSPVIYLERMHRLCAYMRLNGTPSEADVQREAYMAGMIRATTRELKGPLLVVTGGFHSSALASLLAEEVPAAARPPLDLPVELETGIALTPYSYERLDNLRGYASGMPNPGFYHETWHDLTTHASMPTYRKLLARITKMLRERGQIVSAADLIAVESMARSLADLRGHHRVWRRDLIDAVIGALVKEEFAYEVQHPFLEAVYEVFRGYERGRLASGTSLPPLVHEIHALLLAHDLQATDQERLIKLELSTHLHRSQILHQLRVLGIPGYNQIRAFDLNSNFEHAEETWRLQWSPAFDGACIECAIYGPSLEDASRARLQEYADQIAAAQAPDASKAVQLLLDAVLMGIDGSKNDLFTRLTALIGQDSNFFTVAKALSHLLYLYRFDAVLGVAGHTNTRDLLNTTFRRALWLLESLGTGSVQDTQLLNGLKTLLETYERCGHDLGISRDDFTAIFNRIAADSTQPPLLRGAANGVLWTLGQATALREMLVYFAEPDHLGDFLTGLFALAREVVQRQPDLVQQIDGLLVSYDDDRFLTALPALRLAFSFFLPREKYYLTRTLFDGTAVLDRLEVSDTEAAQALAFENALFKAMAHYGVLHD